MFIPESFEVTNTDLLHSLITGYPFGILIGSRDNTPEASHIPFVLDPERGPDGYISPRWYNPGLAVPTWNYAVVHAYGTPRRIDDVAEIHRQQEELVATFEGPDGWTMDSQPDHYIEGMLGGITAFEMPIDRIEGKFKLSQNRSVEDRRSVIAALTASDRPWDHALAELMRQQGF
ncbi:MAG: FMN-binding negative transcriptional regulator [Alphaproteobacteria bacterium]|nr:FMN-binding negative transcriptional regulator [Alphaproteobacteria bacterium]